MAQKLEFPDWMKDAVEKGADVNKCLDILRVNVEQQAISDREERASAREMRKTEMEAEIKQKELALQERELALRESQPTSQIVEGRSHSLGMKYQVPLFKEGQIDIEVFLRSFEKIANVYNWSRDQWPARVVPSLAGKALEAYARMNEEDSKDYDKIKKAILKKYELTSDSYRDKFRATVQRHDENFREYRDRVENLLQHWCDSAEINDFNSLFNLVLREQLIQSSSKELQVWLKENTPETIDDVVKIAEAYQAAHRVKSVSQSSLGKSDRQVVGQE